MPRNKSCQDPLDGNLALIASGQPFKSVVPFVQLWNRLHKSLFPTLIRPREFMAIVAGEQL